VVAIDAPACVSFVGRQQAFANSFVNGKYSLTGAVHGKAAYQHETSDAVIRFDSLDRRWLLAQQNADNACIAWADANDLNHPGDAGLQWHFWEPARQTFIADFNAGAVTSPDVINVFGRSSQAEKINGAYHLAGVHSCRPMYSKLGTQVVIRYSQENDYWLIDCDGLSKPSVLSRMYQWVLTGNSAQGQQTSERCTAWAVARGSEHPGDIDLQWHVYESFAGRHRLEPDVMSTSAPLLIELRGRAASRDNSDINGEYRLIGATGGFPIYEQVGTRTSIYHSTPRNRWIGDRQGLRDSDCCTAYADGFGEHPADVQCWCVFESSRAAFVPDPLLSVVALADTPAQRAVAPQACISDIGVPAACAPTLAMKRPLGFDDELGWGMAYPPAKTARFGNQAGESRWYRSFGA
jgi:hypothetical protein